MFRRFFVDDSGQDIVEYALLGALVGIASILTWQQIAASVSDLYDAANTGVQELSACTPNPGGGGC
jgi:Flp pilus assembly pilin Flp